jgi:ferredoxin-type protein NapG
VRDCPYDTLRLAELGEPVTIGTPYFLARDIPCEMCEDIPCVQACPTGALDKNLTDISKSKMGLARIVDTEGCIAYQGLRCEVCFNVCPVQGKAITLEYKHNNRSGKHALLIPIVHSSDCTGCGKCEQACVMEEATIKVLPLHLAKGQLGEHYRFGWKQKEANGKSLVAPDTEHKFNLPEGVKYNFNEGGLQLEEKKLDSSKALNVLSKGFQEAK